MFLHVLLIDDDPSTNYYNKLILTERQLADQISIAESAEEGLAIVQDVLDGKLSPPEVILLDINMPGMDGWDFIKEFKQFSFDDIKAPYIFMLTNSNAPGEIQKANNLESIHAIFTKPLNEQSIEALVEAVKS